MTSLKNEHGDNFTPIFSTLCYVSFFGFNVGLLKAPDLIKSFSRLGYVANSFSAQNYKCGNFKNTKKSRPTDNLVEGGLAKLK